MVTNSVQELLAGIRALNEERFLLIKAARAVVKRTATQVTEEVKYGGILFSKGAHFCGIFNYKQHISVEFSQGAKLADPLGFLEGSGKGRRHLKLRTKEDIELKHLSQYVSQALAASETAD